MLSRSQLISNLVSLTAIVQYYVFFSFHTPALSFLPLKGQTFRKTSRYHRLVLSAKQKQHHEEPIQKSFMEKLPPTDIPTPFLDLSTTTVIDCYIDSIATINGVEYSIGTPCDTSVALCYFDEGDALVPVELNEALMDEIFPVAQDILEENFGEELVLQRTPQTLTLVGELDDEEDDELEGENFDDDEEEVEVLISFEHGSDEFHLVRLLDPVLLVGKKDPLDDIGAVGQRRILLSRDESDEVMPSLEQLVLEYDDANDEDVAFQ